MASDWEYTFTMDKEEDLLSVYIAGSVLSYVAMVFNMLVIAILARKKMTCPIAVLMQGLGLADFLTACCSYGLEPLFQTKYVCTCVSYSNTEGQECILPYPYCMLASHLSILTMTFHTASYLITTCLGIHKVLAILFPIWTKIHLTNRKAYVCCFISFLLSIASGLPRHFSLGFEDWYSSCKVLTQSLGVLQYSSLYYLILQTIVSTFCSVVMVMSTIFIVYKRVLSSASRNQMSTHRRRERRSMLMVVIILLVFLVTEVPKVSVYFWFCVTYLTGEFADIFDNNVRVSGLLVMRFEHAVAWIMPHFTDILVGNDFQRSLVWNFALEGAKIFTVLGCLSNFIVYIIMSSKLRNEIKHTMRKPSLRSNQL